MDIKILLVEDDPGLSMSLRDRLEASGYNVNCLYSGHRAEEEILDGDYSLVILDIMLKGKNGFDICQAVRTKGNMTPVIMLTARGQLNDKVKGLKLGADDYMTKPFEIAELFARMEALLRRSRVNPLPY
ncbi:MAG TPA: response regulator [Ignavibacteriales bacterium]|nr:response regulator [Ignavibacteriales bacterium]